jgi:uncharacterized protein YjiS (DUF1127 family)
MAHVISASAAVSPFAAIRNAFENARQTLALRAEYNRTYAELSGLTNRELDDIGVARCQIADIASLHVYGR